MILTFFPSISLYLSVDLSPPLTFPSLLPSPIVSRPISCTLNKSGVVWKMHRFNGDTIHLTIHNLCSIHLNLSSNILWKEIRCPQWLYNIYSHRTVTLFCFDLCIKDLCYKRDVFEEFPNNLLNSMEFIGISHTQTHFSMDIEYWIFHIPSLSSKGRLFFSSYSNYRFRPFFHSIWIYFPKERDKSV